MHFYHLHIIKKALYLGYNPLKYTHVSSAIILE